MLGTNYVYPPSQRQCSALAYHKRNDKTTALVYRFDNLQIETGRGVSLGDGSSPAAIMPSIQMNAMVTRMGTSVADLA